MQICIQKVELSLTMALHPNKASFFIEEYQVIEMTNFLFETVTLAQAVLPLYMRSF